MGPPPLPPDKVLRAALKAEARRTVASHNGWGMPATFGTLHWYEAPDGGTGRLDAGTWASLSRAEGGDPIPSNLYPGVMAGLAEDRLRAYPADPPVAFLLAMEVVTGPPPPLNASMAERAEFRAQMAAGTLDQRPGAVTKAVAFVADIRCRVWHAEHTRGNEGEIGDKFYPPGGAPYWPEVGALVAVAQWTGYTAWEVPMVLPGPPR